MVPAVLAGGLAAGVLDISAACAYYAARGVRPLRILQSVAGGIYGRATFQGGWSTAAQGLALHFFIATVAALVFTLAALRLPALVSRPLAFGALYGVAVWAFMHFVVLPLSAVGRRPFDPTMAAIMVAIHIACVGIPIALAARRFLTPPPPGRWW